MATWTEKSLGFFTRSQELHLSQRLDEQKKQAGMISNMYKARKSGHCKMQLRKISFKLKGCPMSPLFL
ncbi:uncharacterized protein PHALS_09835 [Plasmopara halstedii]|uniref:Uncharacterized protein n=1 Tax=Plasmopara halstedii TaxID=4781 RepID=A0A0P1AGC0_PLAHL|nr:uncharacterized protein PHALS_09835 [Plasmopara halstedii]CEG39596.1 hypothetical protein PHALS_09835 [Plasmopara halstedii]|eukprot:XP_024575965.1 hypothetical protein PHALS_09835 [Plasmopara halstedii]